VRGIPTLRYSRKEILMVRRERSITMRLAMEPGTVRFPGIPG
jgi:hypothetical protein